MICERESIWNTEHIGLSYMYLHFHLHIMQIFVLQKHTAKHIIIMLVFGSVLLFWSSIHYYFCDFHVTLSYTVKMCSWFDIMLCHVNLNYCHIYVEHKNCVLYDSCCKTVKGCTQTFLHYTYGFTTSIIFYMNSFASFYVYYQYVHTVQFRKWLGHHKYWNIPLILSQNM